MVLVQKWPFFQVFFLGNIGQENVFYDILERKNAFLSYKNKKFEKSKNCHSSKGVNRWFWSKNDHFSNFSFQAIQARKMSFTIFQNEKTPFQAIKTRSSKSQKIDIFLKGLTQGYGPKMAIFPPFFNQYRREKCVFKYLRMKNRIFRLQKTIFTKSKYCDFSYGVNRWFWSKTVHFR